MLDNEVIYRDGAWQVDLRATDLDRAAKLAHLI